jgi:hypothetical protein
MTPEMLAERYAKWQEIREEWIAIADGPRCFGEDCESKPAVYRTPGCVEVCCPECAWGNLSGYGDTLQAALDDWRTRQHKALDDEGQGVPYSTGSFDP